VSPLRPIESQVLKGTNGDLLPTPLPRSIAAHARLLMFHLATLRKVQEVREGAEFILFPHFLHFRQYYLGTALD
jgi:hypothetical protein